MSHAIPNVRPYIMNYSQNSIHSQIGATLCVDILFNYFLF